MADTINLTKLKESLPRGLIAGMAKELKIHRNKLDNALKYGATTIDNIELLELIVQHRDDRLELIAKLKKSIDGCS